MESLDTKMTKLDKLKEKLDSMSSMIYSCKNEIAGQKREITRLKEIVRVEDELKLEKYIEKKDDKKTIGRILYLVLTGLNYEDGHNIEIRDRVLGCYSTYKEAKVRLNTFVPSGETEYNSDQKVFEHSKILEEYSVMEGYGSVFYAIHKISVPCC